VLSKELDNIVDLRIGTPWPLPPLELTACLAHSFELTGQSHVPMVILNSRSLLKNTSFKKT
jgi:hypothetical protein